MSESTAAHTAAFEAVMLDDPAEVAAAWDRLEAEYGYEVAALAWQMACEMVDATEVPA